MKFSIGDKILLKRTDEEGTVVAIISPTMMEVEVNGVQFPVYSDEVDHPYLKWFTQKKTAQKKVIPEIPVEKPKERVKRLAQGIYLSFMPVYVLEAMEDVVSHFRIYLLNETAAIIHFNYDVISAGGKNLFHHRSSLHAFGNLYLHTLTLEEMNDQPRFHWKMSDGAETLLTSETHGLLKIKPSRLFEQITTIQHSGQPSFSYLLTDEILGLVKPKKIARDLPEIKPAKNIELPAKPEWQPQPVLDLHIENLTEQPETCTPAEMLMIQLNTLQYHLEMAIAHQQDRMIVIHGLGTGALREAVHEVLRTTDGIASYNNDWHGSYGYGATEVIFK